MDMKRAREAAVATAIGEIKDRLAGGVTEAALEEAKGLLMGLAAQTALFPRSDFPIPDAAQIERTFLIHEEADGGYALYVNSSRPGQSYGPHDHGGAWAIVAAVEGAERHRLYAVESGDLRQIGERNVAPGRAIALGPEAIHAIEAHAAAPLLHLHLYGVAFALQGERREYDPETGEVRAFVLENVGFIEDAR
ncbi:MAG: cysteine dioxygenase family protein [Rhodospirillales bacterium]